ncbi:MAG: leucyl/phenylalanyl-tRNA--protein transferase [Gammaproteobacteria bacterium]|nr:leucyl/phenylalanyl-tRNA--protein transferase [Gammaproteobacteria bacterium]
MTHHRGTAPYWIDPDSPEIDFPDVETAMREPDGLLAIGGDLSEDRLLNAYRHGIFPWYGPGQPILWWAPDPRLVLPPENLHVSHSLAKTIRKKKFTVTLDKDFPGTISACAAPRDAQAGTWITPDMTAAYTDLHRAGYAHSVECWHDGELAGGLYGVALGRIFFGESMFARVTDASKIALVTLSRQLQRWDFSMIDCQVHTAHLESLGATTISRMTFSRILERETELQAANRNWALDADLAGT